MRFEVLPLVPRAKGQMDKGDVGPTRVPLLVWGLDQLVLIRPVLRTCGVCFCGRYVALAVTAGQINSITTTVVLR